MKSIYVLSALAAVASATSLSAAVVTIDQGAPYQSGYDNGGMGNGRGVSFIANQDFSISSIGVDLNVLLANTTNYTYQIFASTDGHNVGSLLSSVAFQLGAGSGYRDQAISYAFTAGQYYVVNFARIDNAALGSNLGTHYVWENLGGQSAAVNYGPLTVVEGFEGSPPNNSNPLIPLTRFNTGASTTAVPEPATWAMMIGGFGAVGGAMRYRRRKTTVAFA